MNIDIFLNNLWNDGFEAWDKSWEIISDKKAQEWFSKYMSRENGKILKYAKEIKNIDTKENKK